jgi:L-2-hydroxycarboxylate dehydrogenase (NAD+)
MKCRFTDLDEFKEKVDEYRRVFKSTKPAKGTSGPLLPGDPEFEEEQKRREHGIPLIMPVVEDLKSIGTSVGVPLEE